MSAVSFHLCIVQKRTASFTSDVLSSRYRTMSETSFFRLVYHGSSQGDEVDQFESRGAVKEIPSVVERM